MIECNLPDSSGARCDWKCNGKWNAIRTKYKEFYRVYKRWGFKLRSLVPGDVTATGRIILGVPLCIWKEYAKYWYYIMAHIYAHRQWSILTH